MDRRRALLASASSGGGIPNDEIWYTSSDGKVVEPYNTDNFGTNIVSNTYENGKGVIKCDGDILGVANYAFEDCTSLQSISLPNSVTVIGKWAFYWCTSLQSISLPNSVTVIGEKAFYNTGLTSIAIPANVISIDTQAFKFSTFTSLSFSGDTQLGAESFGSCNSLTSIDFGENMTKIGYKAFYYSSSIPEITIPQSVTEIGDYAFNGCSALKIIRCLRETPPKGGYGMFSGIHSSAIIYVPAGSGNAYKTATNWSSYASKIVEM